MNTVWDRPTSHRTERYHVSTPLEAGSSFFLALEQEKIKQTGKKEKTTQRSRKTEVTVASSLSFLLSLFGTIASAISQHSVLCHSTVSYIEITT